MNKLNEAKWKVFSFKDVFDFNRGKRLTTLNQVNGDIAYISSTKNNNGIDNYITPPEGMKVYKNVLTLNNSGSVGYCFYHPYNIVCSDHCTIISIKDLSVTLNPYIALFLKPIIESMGEKYNFAREISDYRLEKEKIKLPTNARGNPDWNFMENYIKEKAQDIVFSEEIISPKKIIKMNFSNLKEFNLKDIFDISLGKPIHKVNVEFSPNGINYVTRTAFNNGYVGKILQEEISPEDKYCITIGAEGVKAFYQEEPFFTGNKINILRMKNKNKIITRYIGIFLITILNFEMKDKFSYSRAIVNSQLKKMKIKLPADSKGNPHWDFMEKYIKSLPYSSNL